MQAPASCHIRARESNARKRTSSTVICCPSAGSRTMLPTGTSSQISQHASSLQPYSASARSLRARKNFQMRCVQAPHVPITYDAPPRAGHTSACILFVQAGTRQHTRPSKCSSLCDAAVPCMYVRVPAGHLQPDATLHSQMRRKPPPCRGFALSAFWLEA